MEKKERKRATARINELVQDAIERGEFAQLGDDVAGIIGESIKQKKKERIPGVLGNKVKKWFGYIMSVIFGVPFVISLITWIGTGVGELKIPVIMFGLLFVIGAKLVITGKKKESLISRFFEYQAVIADRTYCNVEELAECTGRKCAFVCRDLREMIRQGYFKEGYLVCEETILILDREVYQQYLAGNKKSRKEEPKRTGEQEQKQETPVSQESDELIREGRDYTAYIRECRSNLGETPFSAKLRRLEEVISAILHEVEKNPDREGDLKKMMDYYLPTTKKLLKVYCEMQQQPVAGKNTEEMKREIEHAVDTINGAFERLLDSLFEKKAWDVSAEIEVLQNILMQDGLAENDFKQTHEKKGDKI